MDILPYDEQWNPINSKDIPRISLMLIGLRENEITFYSLNMTYSIGHGSSEKLKLTVNLWDISNDLLPVSIYKQQDSIHPGVSHHPANTFIQKKSKKKQS